MKLLQATVETNPPLCLFVVVLIQSFVLGLVVFNHVGTIRDEKRALREKKEEDMK